MESAEVAVAQCKGDVERCPAARSHVKPATYIQFRHPLCVGDFARRCLPTGMWSATRRRFALHFLPCACSYPHQQAHQAEHLWNRFLPADNAVTVGCKMVKFQPRAHWHTHPRRRAPTCCASPASRLLRGARPTRTPVSATTSPASGQSGAASAAMSLASRTLRWARIMASFPAQSTHSTVAYAPYCRAHTTAAMSLALRTRCSGHAHRGLVLRAVDTQLHMLYRRAHD